MNRQIHWKAGKRRVVLHMLDASAVLWHAPVYVVREGALGCCTRFLDTAIQSACLAGVADQVDYDQED